ncbi:RcpC/CpaB family pilus assembly protein [Nesterenkonia sp. F]|uniref:RcpC/CpaB family pilus assembly protein n=1 Tax=Nesterenkonia sp. F TaxID=795955 RepID=UPI00031EE1D7|nr:RcpC/CpaB family pilus assembly protein [Nesterenkonia sp. F]
MRLPLALLFACCAVAAGMLAGGTAPPGEVVTVVRTTAEAAVGETLEAAQLETARVDADSVPVGAAAAEWGGSGESGGEPDEGSGDAGGDLLDRLAGRQAAVPLPEGVVVLESQLVGPGLLDGQAGDVVAMPVRPADTALVGMLTPGRRVDVLVSGSGPEAMPPAETVAEGAPVLWTPQSASDDWLPADGQAGEVVILAVEPEVAETLAEAAHRGRIDLSLVE